MEKKRFEEEMSKKSKILGVRFSVEQIEQFYKYMNLLIEWNEKMNLTAITEPKEIILKHFIDSITILKYIDDNSKLVDVGTGAGFPGVPLSIMNPTLKITLVDSLNKRLIFLQEVSNIVRIYSSTCKNWWKNYKHEGIKCKRRNKRCPKGNRSSGRKNRKNRRI